MIPVPIIPSNFVTSLADMVQGQFGGSGLSSTPHTGLINLPNVLVGVPMIKAINNIAYACSVDRGPIHAYGLRTTG
jgi:hypothetical protein